MIQMRAHILRKTVLGLGVATAALMAPAAMAQEATAQSETASSGLDEIIVTAQRRSESIQDVPLAITAISSETLRQGNVRGIGEVIALTPNISFQSNGSRDRKDLAIRGISNQLNPTSDVRQTSTPFYIDEFNVVAGTSNPQIVDLERVEVLRGPQGTYFGRNSIGGAINVITKKPVDRFEGEVELGYSSFDTRRAMGVLNVPVVPGLLAIRASGQYEKTDGNIKNINPIGGGNEGEFWTGRIQARLTPTEGLTWDFTYSYSDEVLGMRDGVPTGYVTNTWNSVYYVSRGLNTNPLDPDISKKVTDPDGVGFFPTNNNRVNFNRPQQVGSTYQFASTRFEWDLEDVTLTGVLGHLKSDVVNFGDVDGSSKDFFYEDFVLTRKSTSGELRLASNGTRFFNWNIGFFMGRDTGLTDQSTFHGAQSPLCPAVFNGSCNGLEATGLDSNSSTKYLAMFGETSFNVTDQFQVIFGLRYSYEKTFNVSQTRSNGNVTGTNNRNAPFEDVSPKVTLRYKPSDDLMFYATAARGFKAGGTQTSGSALLSNDFQPETIWNYEVGTKFSLFDNRLRFDVSAFYMDWKDVQQTIRFQFVGANNAILSVSGVANAGAAESYGLEAAFDASISDNLTLSGFLGFNENKWTDFKNALIEGVILDVTGKRLVNAPRWTAGAQAQYNQPINDTTAVFARAEWQYRGETLATPFAYRYPVYPFIAPDYHNVNLRAGVDIGKFRATVFVENLFNARYFNNAYEKAFYSGAQVEPSLQRIGGTIGYKF